MPAHKSKKNVQQTNQADPSASAMTAVVLTPEHITVTLVQLLEGQCQTQQQNEALLAQQNNPKQVDIEGGLAPIQTLQRAWVHPSHAEDARDIINDRRATREER